jgi:hypothetical protein
MKLLLSLFLVLSSLAWAEDDKTKFEERKKNMLEGLDKRISLLQKEKSCISSAADVATVKSCIQTSKEEHEKLKRERKEQRRQNVDEKIKKLEGEKQKLQ